MKLQRITLSSDAIWYILAGVALAIGIFFRFFRPDIDPPFFFAGTTQDLLTDPYNVTYFARNKILFGVWDIFDYPRWLVFKYTLSSFAAYIAFAVAGVSRVTANFSAAILNLGGILLFLAGLWKHSRKASAVAAIFLLCNITLLTYGRYPFMENGLIFLSGLMFFLFTGYHQSRLIGVITGVIVSLCFLSGKAFGILMVIPPLFVLWKTTTNGRYNKMFIIISSTLFSILILALSYYGKEFNFVYQYLSEQSVGMYGSPAALTSPISLIIQIMTFGGQSRLFYFVPFLLILIVMTLLAFIWKRRSISLSTGVQALLFFNAAWLAAGFLLLMLFNHRPLRYQLFLLLPVAGLIGLAASHVTASGADKTISRFKYISTFLIYWYLGTQVILIFSDPTVSESVKSAVWLGLIPGVFLSAFTFLFSASFLKILRETLKYSALIALLFILHQGYWIYKWLDKATFDLKRAGQDLSQIVGQDAAVVGPFSSALTIDNNLQSFIYMFGLVRKEPELFSQFELTHIATDEANQQAASRDYGNVVQDLPVTRYFVRDVEVQIIKLDGQGGSSSNSDYTPTDYEIAARHYNDRQTDSAEIYLNQFLLNYPHNRSGLVMLGNIYLQTQRFDAAIKTFNTLIDFYPNDAYLYFYNALYNYRLYLLTRENEFLKQSERLYDLAVKINPTLLDDVEISKKQALEMFR